MREAGAPLALKSLFPQIAQIFTEKNIFFVSVPICVQAELFSLRVTGNG